MRLLHAADTIPRGGVFSGYYALQASLRYVYIWLQMLTTDPDCKEKSWYPPLDVAVAWFVHRQDPERFAADCESTVGTRGDPTPAQAFGFGCVETLHRRAWERRAGKAHPMWPPGRPGSPACMTRHPAVAASRPAIAIKLAESMQHYGGLLHSWLRPQFLDPDFLDHARRRYCRFLSLHVRNPTAVLVPTADIALMWHTHLGMSSEYVSACRELLSGAGGAPWSPAYVTLGREELARAYSDTARLWWESYKEPYDSPDTAWVPLAMTHPLAAPASPFAHVLGTYDDPDPRDADALAAVAKAARGWGATSLRFEAGAVPHSGAHAMYMAWVVHRAMLHAYELE